MLPIIRGTIARRILINYRVDPDVLARELPAPFRPRVYRGHSLVGICLIRLESLRPTWLPSWLGVSSENAAHRAAVEWDENGVPHSGVFIRRRDSDSWLNSALGGRLFPGIHHRAQFEVHAEACEKLNRIEMRVESDDGATRISLAGKRAAEFPRDSIFPSLAEASAFYESGGLGYSATSDPDRFDGLELCCQEWKAEPLEIEHVSSSYFDDASIFPPGSIAFDNALLMRDIEHEWHGRSELRAFHEIAAPAP